MSEVDIETFAAARDKAPEVIDVREVFEYVDGHVPGAKLIPMGQLPSRLAELDRSGPVYVLCASGGRSAAMTDFLRDAGYDAYSVVGGTGAWAGGGRGLVRGSEAG